MFLYILLETTNNRYRKRLKVVELAEQVGYEAYLEKVKTQVEEIERKLKQKGTGPVGKLPEFVRKRM